MKALSKSGPLPRLLPTLLLSCFAAACAPMASSQDRTPMVTQAPPAPSISTLNAFIGTYDYDALLARPAVARALTKLSPDGALRPRLDDLFGVKEAIGSTGTCLTLSGFRPHMGDVTGAFMLVCNDGNALHIALREDSNIDVYSPYADYMNLPREIRQWVEGQNRTNGTPLSAKPANVTLHP